MLNKAIKRTFSDILCDLKTEPNGLRVIVLQNFLKKNALSSLFVNQLQNHLKSLHFDKEAKTLILKSAVSNTFCAGADLKERAVMPAEDIEKFVNNLRFTFDLLEDIEIPTIACIEGYALGGGLEMALACDLRIASPLAKVGLVETGIAVIPGAGGTFRLPKIVGLQRAKEMIFTASIYNAETAKNFGLFNEVADDAYGKSVEIANNISKNGPIAVKMAKKALNLSFGKERATAMSIEGLCYAQVIHTEDRTEALSAFKEKRKPVFEGK